MEKLLDQYRIAMARDWQKLAGNRPPVKGRKPTLKSRSTYDVMKDSYLS